MRRSAPLLLALAALTGCPDDDDTAAAGGDTGASSFTPAEEAAPVTLGVSCDDEQCAQAWVGPVVQDSGRTITSILWNDGSTADQVPLVAPTIGEVFEIWAEVDFDDGTTHLAAMKAVAIVPQGAPVYDTNIVVVPTVQCTNFRIPVASVGGCVAPGPWVTPRPEVAVFDATGGEVEFALPGSPNGPDVLTSSLGRYRGGAWWFPGGNVQMDGLFSGYTPMYPPVVADPLSAAWFPPWAQPSPHFTFWIAPPIGAPPVVFSVVHRMSDGSTEPVDTIKIDCDPGSGLSGLQMGGSG